MTTPGSPAPSTAPRASASTRGGNDRTASISRITSPSARPPAYPAARPSSPPAARAMATEAKPATSEMRVPQITRESTSRPTLSVPRGCAQLGRSSAWSRFCLRGSWGDSAGANAAARRAASSTAAPKGARRAAAARRRTTQGRARSDRGGAGAARLATRSASSDPGIDEAIEHVHEEVAHDEADGDQQHHALHEGVVPREHGVDDEAADAGEGEHVLCDHRPPDQRAEL